MFPIVIVKFFEREILTEFYKITSYLTFCNIFVYLLHNLAEIVWRFEKLNYF